MTNTTNNDEDCPKPSYFFLRQHGTNHPVGCVALEMTGIGDSVKASVSMCAPTDFYDKDRGWNRRKAVDAAVGKLKSGRYGVVIDAPAADVDLDDLAALISERMVRAMVSMGVDFERGNELLRKQIIFLRRRHEEDKAASG